MPPSNGQSYSWGQSQRGNIFLVNVEGHKQKIRIFLILLNEISFSNICIVCEWEDFKLSGIWHWKLLIMLFYKDFSKK